MKLTRALGVFALTMLAAGIVLTVFDFSGTWESGFGLTMGVVSAAIVLAVVAVVTRLVGTLLERPHGESVTSRRIAAAGPGRMRLARLCSALALVSLVGGSAFLAVFMISVSVAAQDDPDMALGLVFVPFIWSGTFVLSWALVAAAFAAKGTLDPAAAVLAFPVGLLAGVTGLLLLAAASLSDTPEAPRVAFVVVLAVLDAAAVYFVLRKFWAPPRPPAGLGPGSPGSRAARHSPWSRPGNTIPHERSAR
jgi:hypothetical protein